MTNKALWVVKVGSALITDEDWRLNSELIQGWVEQIVTLRERGINVVLVSSGAIAEGMRRIGWRERPTNLIDLQSAAAVGQMGLMEVYVSLFSKHQLKAAQFLVTHENFTKEEQRESISLTLKNLLNLDTVPIFNENDTVSADEIRFGDNDTLAARLACLIAADQLLLLTDQGGLYQSDPRQDKNARLITRIPATDKRLDRFESNVGGPKGSGGIYTKILAAREASTHKISTIIASGREPNVLVRLSQGEKFGSLLYC